MSSLCCHSAQALRSWKSTKSGVFTARLQYHHRVVVNILAHLLTPWLWRGYGHLSRCQQLAWTNRIASALHVSVPTKIVH